MPWTFQRQIGSCHLFPENSVVEYYLRLERLMIENCTYRYPDKIALTEYHRSQGNKVLHNFWGGQEHYEGGETWITSWVIIIFNLWTRSWNLYQKRTSLCHIIVKILKEKRIKFPEKSTMWLLEELPLNCL